jgi:tetratricopeptide (TPR) repeat protein
LVHYERAIELNPQASDIYRVMAYYYSMIRKFDDALQFIEKAIELDPLDLNIQLSYGEILYRCKYFEKAINVLTTFTKDHQDSKIAWIILANAYFFNGNLKAFREIFSRIDEYTKPISFYLFTAYSNLVELGEEQKVRNFLAILEEEKSENWISSTSIALLYLALRNDVKAEYYLKTAIKEKDPVIMIINSEPAFSKYQKHPLIQATLKKIGLKET